jgi:hypothetical protein
MQQGPFTLEELQAKNITAETPVWYEGLPDWTTAGQVEELKAILVHTPPPFHAVPVTPVEQPKPVTPVAAAPVEQPKPVTPVAAATVTVTETQAPAATVMAAPAPVKSAKGKKSTAWLSYVLSLLVLGAVGYYIYQDMEKNKDKGTNTGINSGMQVSDSTRDNTSMQQPGTEQPTTMMPSSADTEKNGTIVTPTAEPDATTPTTTTTTPVTTTTTPVTTTTTPVTTTTTTVTPKTKPPVTVVTTTKQTDAANKAKQEEAKKLALKKIEEDKKKILAAQAAAAKELEYRNNWSHYISIGKYDYKVTKGGVEAFNVPVYNGTNAMLDQVTVLVEYMKKDKKIYFSEPVKIYNIPSGGGLNGKAAGYDRGNNVRVTIQSITCGKLHFCYPFKSSNPADPYFCN